MSQPEHGDRRRPMRHAGWLAPSLALLIGSCSWIPFIDSDGPHLTNAAVEACKRKADALGYNEASERQSTPGSDGRYTVMLDIRQNQGYGQISCAWDPAKGADIAPPKAAGK